ncbi:MAG: hypothetical protein NC218_03745 [Acetobacter sp.]|nr:hypothetical protein [Acetobacter sp.]
MADVNQVKQEIKEIEALITKILKKIKKPNLEWRIQFAMDSGHPNMIQYSAYIESPEARVGAFTWIQESYENLVKSMTKFLEDVDEQAVEVAYHKGQIQACEKTIKHHENMIKAILEEDDEQKPESE